MNEGQRLDSEALYKTHHALVSLGIFRNVEVEMLSPDRPEPLKTVLLKVNEMPRFSGEFGLGYFLAEGPRVVLDGNAPNLGGRAINLSGHLQGHLYFASWPVLTGQVATGSNETLSQVGFRGNVTVESQSLLPADIGLRVDVVAERVFRPQFSFFRVAGVPSIDWG